MSTKKRIYLNVVCALLVSVLASGTVASAYNKNNAAKYAQEYALKYNTRYISYSSDCTNFVSQCLENGGYKQNNTWCCGLASSTKEWSVADTNYHYILQKKWGKLYKRYSKNGKYSAPNSYITVDTGSLVYYDWDGDGKINHASFMSFSGQNKSTGMYQSLICQHTTNRKNVTWNLQSYLKDYDKKHNSNRASKCVYYVVDVG